MVAVKEDWHLSKTVTIGNMMTMACAILAMVGSYYTLDRRLALLEASSIAQEKHIYEIDGRIMNRLDRIEGLIMKVHFDVPNEN